MICERCGNTLSDTATLCTLCGRVYGSRKTEGPLQYAAWRQQEVEFEKYGSSSQPGGSSRGKVPLQRTMLFGTSFQLSNDGSVLIVEILLSLFGVFGVGWLLSGRTLTGIVLLLCSLFLYWPFMIAATILTLGVGLIFLGPFAIFCIIVNAFLLTIRIKRRALHSIMRQHSQRVPPMH